MVNFWQRIVFCGVLLIGTVHSVHSDVQRFDVTTEGELSVLDAQQGTTERKAAGKPAALSLYEPAFQKIWQTVQKEFHDANLNGVDWNKVGKTYHARLPEVKDKAEFKNLMNEMLATLHASHTSYVDDDEAEYYMLRSVSMQDMQNDMVEHIGIMGRQEGKEYLVSAVLDGGPAEKAGIQPGDRLQAADGKAFSSAGSFRGKEGVPVQVQARRQGEDKSRSIAVTPIKSNMLQAYLAATRRSARIMEVGARKIGYVHLWTMAQDSFRKLLENLVLTKLHDTDGLILDLRDGYGGHPFNFSDVFFRPDVAWSSQYQNGKPVVQNTGYSKPMVVLINEGTRSAKEFLTYQFKIAHRATILGTQTAGAFLGAKFVRIGADGLLELAAVDLKVDGKRLENNGVTPDIQVAAKDIYSAQDAQLAQAMKVLTEREQVH